MQQTLDSIQNITLSENKPILAILVAKNYTLNEAQVFNKTFATRSTLFDELGDKSFGKLEFTPILLLIVLRVNKQLVTIQVLYIAVIIRGYCR
jgi:hypothetical protein